MTKLKWGILGTGTIAHAFARDLKQSQTGELYAVGSRALDTAEAFAKEFEIPRPYPTYEDFLSDPAIDAVYIATPHTSHAENAIATAEAGKHILCEKPLTVHYEDSLRVIEAAKKNDVFLMEAFMYRCHPQTQKIVDLIREKAIGEVRMIVASFGFTGDFPLDSRLLMKEFGGGAILDVGCYPVSMARLIAGAAIGENFADPIGLQGFGHIGEKSGVDEYAVAVLKFPNDILAKISTGCQVEEDNTVQVFGTKGKLIVPSPWFCGTDRDGAKLLLSPNDSETHQEIAVEAPLGLYTYEADVLAAHLQSRQAPSPCMTWEDTLGNMKTLARWLEAVGMRYL